MFLGKRKDGGKDSKVTGFFFEIKSLFTIALLKFDPGTREAYHNHAFNCVSLVLGPGYLEEEFIDGSRRFHERGSIVKTKREHFHKVRSQGTTWVLTIRGRWSKTWNEYTEQEGLVTLAQGRKVVND
jgi:hypothetical protein